jgi:hypothetical protein
MTKKRYVYDGKLPNGATILAERPIPSDPENMLIVAYFPLSYQQFVCWSMKIADRSDTYWGHYYDSALEAFDYFTFEAYPSLIPELSQYKSIVVHPTTYQYSTNTYIKNDHNRNADMYITYGKLSNGQEQSLVSHYQPESARNYADWLATYLKITMESNAFTRAMDRKMYELIDKK